ncbi:MAG: hypothetical protein WC717_05785 [Candidatus Micrarchaeia archaeon]
MDGIGEGVLPLVKEKQGIEARLTQAGGSDFSFLLKDCSDLEDIIGEIEEVSSKRGEKEHAAFEAKVKFSRKVRRKAKDLKNFESHLVKEYESGHITLEHGRKMVSIIKLLRSNDLEKAKREAAEFHLLYEMGARLEALGDALSKKRAQVERAKRGAEAQLSDLEWLENEPQTDAEKVERRNELAKTRETINGAWSNHLQTLKSMPLCNLLKKIRDGELGKMGFSGIDEQNAEALAAFLQKSRLEAKTAGELYEMAGQSEQLLRHLGIDLPLFRQEIVARKPFLFGIMSYSPDPRAIESRSPALSYLSGQDEGVRKAAERLAELEKTKEADESEWARANRMEQKTAELAGVEKQALVKSLEKLRALEDILDGKATPEGRGKEESSRKGEGIVGSIIRLFGGNLP